MSTTYISTRGDKTPVTASEAIIKGIAPDGGLYTPIKIPSCPLTLKQIAAMDYQELAYEILKLYLTDFTEGELRQCVSAAYGEGFDCPEIAPVVRKNGVYFLELFHGRTLAFKDMALSILPHLMTVSRKKLGIEKKIAILTATSGDTGKAALAGFAGVEGTHILVFYPLGGVSDVQRLQMVTQEGENVSVIGVSGNFDDAQSGVKDIFTDKEFNLCLDKKGFMLSSANSINIGRLVPQIVYYFYAYGQLMKTNEIEAGEKVNFVVPTGNFGNILAAYYAKKMGLPINDLVCASNSNNVLFDFFKTNIYNKNRDFVLTVSPSMDILISSNLERLLFDISGGDGQKIKQLMEKLKADGAYEFNAEKSGIKAQFANENETLAAIKEMANFSYVMDTHTAVAYSSYQQYINNCPEKERLKTVVVSTASPYKFGADVLRAVTGKDYNGYSPSELFDEMENISETPVPAAIDNLDKKPVLHTASCSKDGMKAVTENILN